jgi:hypothetical protein
MKQRGEKKEKNKAEKKRKERNEELKGEVYLRVACCAPCWADKR